MLKTNRTIFVVALVAVVNMLGYGIVIPVLYAYSKKFGLSDFDNGLLFAAFSVCQFISTPIIGRLSDKYGRRPMLLVSIAGTAVSFFVMAFAPNVAFLYLARMLDGLTAGNVPVIFAVISDSTEPRERPKAFGIVGSAFSLGFVFGPAISSLTVGFGEGIPFIIAGIVTVIATIIAAIYLPETNTHQAEVPKEKLFDFKKMWQTLFDPNVGVTFLITLIFFFAFACSIMYGFQPYTMNVLKLSPSQNAMLFTLFGVVGFLTQNLAVERVTKAWGVKKAFKNSLFFTAVAFLLIFATSSLPIFIFASILMGFFNSISQTMIPTILSQETDAKSQGSIMGLNSSYQSIGTIFGPIVGGLVATISTPFPFLLGGLLILVCYFLASGVMRPGVAKESAY
ncbi:MFS transporter [Candidatus Shapirobacteria bacterium]|nr:MFS transporter [Candidatus Shapirobacteria bacterium]